jgi:hypothetical protein
VIVVTAMGLAKSKGIMMIEFFTALVLHYELQGKELEAVMWFETEADCQAVMQNDIAAPLYDELYDLYGNNIMMFCEVSETVSNIIRPTARPTQENN